jgi:hypothetical protein
MEGEKGTNKDEILEAEFLPAFGKVMFSKCIVSINSFNEIPSSYIISILFRNCLWKYQITLRYFLPFPSPALLDLT